MTYAHQRKRAKANRRAKAAKAAQQPTEGVYVHPSPFDTNIYWHEEMILGPGPPQRKGNRDRNRTESTKRLNTGGQESSAGGSSADTTLVVQSFDGVREEDEEEEGRRDEGWNRRRYQRADEMLWGQEDPTIPSYFTFGSSTANKPIVDSDGTYYGYRNPAVNDLHPPVVSTQPTHPNHTRWMLQPPPSAKVMAGKERANRSRSTSAASYSNSSRGTGGAMAGKQIVAKSSLEDQNAMLNTGNATVPKMGNESIYVDSSRGQQHERDMESSSDSDELVMMPSKKRRPPPIRVIDDSRNRISRARSGPLEARPRLTTIESSEMVQPAAKEKGLPHTGSTRSTHLDPGFGALPSASSSLQALQELAPATSSLNMRAPSPSHEASIRLPSATEAEERYLALPTIPSRFPGGESFRFPPIEPPAPKTGDKNPTYRWSMDI